MDQGCGRESRRVGEWGNRKLYPYDGKRQEERKKRKKNGLIDSKANKPGFK